LRRLGELAEAENAKETGVAAVAEASAGAEGGVEDTVQVEGIVEDEGFADADDASG